jgi:hypothetical protein
MKAIHNGLRWKRAAEYSAWVHLQRRCFNEKDSQFHYYGGRGITVCARWLDDGGFLNFLADMGPRPGQGYSIDRIDNDKGYSPENCRWATRTVQQNNRRNSRMIEFRGRRQTLCEWAREVEIHPDALRSRLRCGWAIADALTK